MLKENQLKKKILNKNQAIGLFCSIPSPTAVELIAEAGFDFVIIDTEHVMVNPETLENMIRAAEALGITPLVRLSDNNPKVILKILDCGAQGIVIPMVESAQSVEDVIKASKYFPMGERSLNGGRPGAFGKNSLVDYMEYANQQIMVIPMIESKAGVQAVDEIVKVDGVDLILEGAADLSQSLGVPWKISSENVQQALLRIYQACTDAGIAYCAIPRAEGQYEMWLDRGAKTFVLGDERGIAFRALQEKLKSTLKGS